MKIGVLVETEEGLDWDRWRATFVATERLGFESLWISDHLESPWATTRHGLDPWIALSVAAAETRRVVLGPLVSPITFREPIILARMAECIADLAPRRFVIGLGLGWNETEHAAAGIAFPPVRERSRRLIEGIERIRCELGERHVPVLIGGSGPRSTLPIVARYADEWNITTSSPAEYARAATQLERLCGEIGRNPREIRHSVAVGVLIGRDAAELASRCDRMRSVVPPLAQVEDVATAAREMGWIVGTPADVVGQLKALKDLGVERAILGHYDLDQTETLATVARYVLPEVE